MPASLFTLPILQQLSPSISLRKKDQLDIIVIKHPQFQAAMALQGGQLLAWQPKGQSPVIWLSEASDFTQGKAIRGGVPICWPWFGPAGKPSHGFARTRVWQLEQHQEDDKSAQIQLQLTHCEQTLALWPHPFTLKIALTVTAEACHLELQISTDQETTAALHSYFHVGDITQVSVAGLGSPYIDKVQANTRGQHSGEQYYLQEVDRIFTAPSPISIITDGALKRQVQVEHHGNCDVVTWNPGQALSIAMADMADQGYQSMVCVETACIHQPIIASLEQPATLAVTFRPR